MSQTHTPLRSVINYVRDNRANYGKVRIIYGARSVDDLVAAVAVYSLIPESVREQLRWELQKTVNTRHSKQ